MPRRDAVTTASESASYVKRQQSKCADLEHRLVQQTNEAAVNQYRMRLCEGLADWIMTCPQSAHEYDAVGRLWKHCFYSRIGPARQKILRDQRKQKPGVDKQQDRLQAFLGEGVTLFDYLCDKLTSILTSGEEHEEEEEHEDLQDQIVTKYQKNGQSRNGSEENEIDLPSNPKSSEGVVPCLHRLCIHLGDLFRYANQYAKAQQAYSTAAQLAPWMGHAYNQLAVTVQVKDDQKHAAVTVYWYARSLASVKEPFTTAHANLQRIFRDNREWLHQQNVGQAQQPKTVVLSSSASRLFLSTFVDLHYDLFEASISIETNDNEAAANISPTFSIRVRESVETFRQLLSASALGDSLLCKMVAIGAFSECQAQSSSIRRVARMTAFEYGTALAERVVSILEHKKKLSSIRVLMPLLLLTEYLMLTKALEGQQQPTFWKAIVQIYNVLKKHESILNDESNVVTQLKEFEMLRGFAPFEPFLKIPNEQDTITADGYLSNDAAAKLLEEKLADSNSNSRISSQHTASGSVTSNSADGTGYIKVHRFLALSLSDNVDCISESQDGTLEWVDPASLTDKYNENVEDDDVNMADENEVFKSDGLLVYQQAETGGPALLVPGAILKQHQKHLCNNNNNNDNVAPAGTSVQLSMSNETADLTGLNGILGIHQSIQQPSQASLQQLDSSFPYLAQQQHDIPSFLSPPPGFGGSVGAPAPPINQPVPSLYEDNIATTLDFDPILGRTNADAHVARIGESYNLFGGEGSFPVTNNPFALRSTSFEAGMHTSIPKFSALFEEDTSNALDGTTTILDSGWLNRLLMDDSTVSEGTQTTKNPFAI